MGILNYFVPIVPYNPMFKGGAINDLSGLWVLILVLIGAIGIMGLGLLDERGRKSRTYKLGGSIAIAIALAIIAILCMYYGND